LAGEAGLRQLQARGPRVVVMTRGGAGEMVVCCGEESSAVSPYQVPVVYDVGAGDTFHAGLVAAAMQHDLPAMTCVDWREAVRFAAATAAIRVSTSGNPHDLPSFPQVRQWMYAWEVKMQNAK
jgi:fructokinase